MTVENVAFMGRNVLHIYSSKMENYAQRVIASSGVCVQLLRWDLSSGFYQDFLELLPPSSVFRG